MGKFYATLYAGLSLYVRQLAWLHTAPQRDAKDRSTTPVMSRLTRMRWEVKDDDYMPKMPDTAGAEYLLGYLLEIGPVLSSGMGPGVLTYQEIDAWARLNSINIQPWEVRCLRRLSTDYLTQARAAERSTCPAPATEARAAITAADLRASMRQLAKL